MLLNVFVFSSVVLSCRYCKYEDGLCLHYPLHFVSCFIMCLLCDDATALHMSVISKIWCPKAAGHDGKGFFFLICGACLWYRNIFGYFCYVFSVVCDVVIYICVHSLRTLRENVTMCVASYKFSEKIKLLFHRIVHTYIYIYRV